MRSIVKSIFEHSKTFPKKTALIATDHTLDYETLWKLIAGMAQLLKDKGLQKGQRVILEADHTAEFMVMCYGIHLAGVQIDSGKALETLEKFKKVSNEEV